MHLMAIVTTFALHCSTGYKKGYYWSVTRAAGAVSALRFCGHRSSRVKGDMMVGICLPGECKKRVEKLDDSRMFGACECNHKGSVKNTSCEMYGRFCIQISCRS